MFGLLKTKLEIILFVKIQNKFIIINININKNKCEVIMSIYGVSNYSNYDYNSDPSIIDKTGRTNIADPLGSADNSINPYEKIFNDISFNTHRELTKDELNDKISKLKVKLEKLKQDSPEDDMGISVLEMQISRYEMNRTLGLPVYVSTGEITISATDIENQQFPDLSTLSAIDKEELKNLVDNRLTQIRDLQNLPDLERQQELQKLGKTQDDLNKLESELGDFSLAILKSQYMSPMDMMKNQ